MEITILFISEDNTVMPIHEPLLLCFSNSYHFPHEISTLTHRCHQAIYYSSTPSIQICKSSLSHSISTMDQNSHPLATESFSYSWLTDNPPPLIRRIEHEDNFHFHASHTHLVNAEEIFSHGQIMPVYADKSRMEASEASTSFPSSPPSIHPPRNPLKDYYVLGKWRRSSKRILQKFLGLLKRSRKSSRVDDLERKVLEVRSLSHSLETSPRQSSAYSFSDLEDLGYGFDVLDHWRSSTSIVTSPRSNSYVCCDADENSIHEAILYCKRSIDK